MIDFLSNCIIGLTSDLLIIKGLRLRSSSVKRYTTEVATFKKDVTKMVTGCHGTTKLHIGTKKDFQQDIKNGTLSMY